jgi:hypothetical protein
MHSPMRETGAARARFAYDPALPTIWEAGHYYHAKGPTVWSAVGWRVMAKLAHRSEARMLFVDDVHPETSVHHRERGLDRIMFNPIPKPTHLALESGMLEHGKVALEHLKKLPKRRKARKIGGRWHCSGFPLEGSSGQPLCLFFDLGLTWHKRQLGFHRAVNVVPEYYAEEQRRLVRLVKKAMPDFQLIVLLHDIEGALHTLD